MRFSENPFQVIQARLVEGMVSYMRVAEGMDGETRRCGYEQKHIDHCLLIVEAYLASVAPERRLLPEQIRGAVQTVVVQLNDLNDMCGGKLIETDQREDLCELILREARDAGLEMEVDITEAWRWW